MRIVHGRQRFTWHELQWSERSVLYNIFRIGEWIFGRKNEIRAEARTIVTENRLRREFYTWEALLVHIECSVRYFFSYGHMKEIRAALAQQYELDPFFLQRGVIAFDAVTTSAATGSSVSFSHTVTGSNPFLVNYNSTNDSTVTATSTYAGAATTGNINKTSGDGQADLRSKAAPATGTTTLAITWSAAPAASRQAQVAISFSGVGQTQADAVGATVANATTSATSASVSITTTATDSMLIDGLQLSSADVSITGPGGSQTQRWNFTGGDVACKAGGSERAAATVQAYTNTWTWDGTTRSFGNVIMEMKIATAAPAAGGIPTLLTLMTG